ncbi:hypothetical protein GCM10029964_056190 [Kibdelosporangium lantanae]
MATAVPVNALSSEMTTGMSAPPMGSTMVTPNASAARISRSSAVRLAGSITSQVMPVAKTSPSRTLTGRAPGNTMGRLGIRPCSLPAATSDPANVTTPIRMSSAAGTLLRAPSSVVPAVRRISLTASSAAALPPTALNMLTSWGMAVIRTARAA